MEKRNCYYFNTPRGCKNSAADCKFSHEFNDQDIKNKNIKTKKCIYFDTHRGCKNSDAECTFLHTPNDQAILEDTSYVKTKQRYCDFFNTTKGCTKSDEECKFLHQIINDQSKPNKNFKTKECKFFNTLQGCKNSDECNFIHSTKEDDVKTIDSLPQIAINEIPMNEADINKPLNPAEIKKSLSTKFKEYLITVDDADIAWFRDTYIKEPLLAEIKEPLLAEIKEPLLAEIKEPLLAEIKEPLLAAAEIKEPLLAAEIKEPPAAVEIKEPPAAVEIKEPPAVAEINEPPADEINKQSSIKSSVAPIWLSHAQRQSKRKSKK
jgi:hypothetical protein